MHYIFKRRLNMLEIGIHELKEEELSAPETAGKLLEEYSISIPALCWDKAERKVKKEKLTTDSAPENFHVDQNEEYSYLSYTVPFSTEELISDLLPLGEKKEGLSIRPGEIEYREYSHEEIVDDSTESNRLQANALKATADVTLELDEFAADAVEFNQIMLPAAIAEMLVNEKQRRLVN